MLFKTNTTLLSFIFFLFFLSCIKIDGLSSIQLWEKKYKINWQVNEGYFQTLSKSGDSWSYYKLATAIDSNNAMYLATNKSVYIEKNIELINNCIDKAVLSSKLPNSQHKDEYCAWANYTHTEKINDGKEYALFEAFVWRYVTTTLKIIYRNNLQDDYNIDNDYTKILDFSITHIFKKWMERGKKNIYTINTNMSSHWALISLNLWIITKDKKYKNVVYDFNEKLKNHFISSSDSYIWASYWDAKKYSAKIQDVSHGNGEVNYIIECSKENISFSQLEIQKLINTLNSNILNNNQTSLNIDGSGFGKGRILDGFLKLGRYSRSLQDELTHLELYGETEYYKHCQYYANMALNESILLQS